MLDVDLFEPETQECPYPSYAALRDEAPVFYMPSAGMYIVSRYEDILEISRNPKVFAQGPAPKQAYIQDPDALKIWLDQGIPRPGRIPLSTDPPIHRRYRAMVDGFFTARAVEKKRDLIEKVANELIDSWIDSTEIEFVSQFAQPLPVAVITLLMGFPADSVPDLCRWSEAWVMQFDGKLTAEQERYVAEQNVEFQRFIMSVVEEKRRRPDETLLSHLGNAKFKDLEGTPRRLTDSEIVYMVDQLHAGGNETTAFAITSALWLMLSNPQVHQQIRADHSLIEKFIEESLRLESPTQGMARHTTEDVEVNGVLIPKGSTVHLRFAAGNRDPRFFSSADHLDLSQPNSHRNLAFGQGEHHCVGANLSRFEQRIAFKLLLDRIEDWWLLPEKNDYRHRPGLILRAMNQLHVGIRAKER
ncbi:cytochrome P450 [Streptomyces sp. NPDC001984]|uniref:cytochrome P450 n=1 Tax=Streptomyces sp. NPDC002619 TaxID=3364655 RepID=UPI0036A94CC4